MKEPQLLMYYNLKLIDSIDMLKLFEFTSSPGVTEGLGSHCSSGFHI